MRLKVIITLIKAETLLMLKSVLDSTVMMLSGLPVLAPSTTIQTVPAKTPHITFLGVQTTDWSTTWITSPDSAGSD